jgi:hypothetical protein
VAPAVLKDANASHIPSHSDFCTLAVHCTAFLDLGINASIAFPHDQILMQDDVGGLEVEDLNRPGSFIVR